MAIFQIDPAAVPAALSMGVEDFRARMRGDDPKTAPNGRPTFTSGVVVTRDGGGADRSASIAIIEKPTVPWPLGTPLRAEGDCWLTPYVTNDNRQGLSFVVTKLVPVTPTAQHRGDKE